MIRATVTLKDLVAALLAHLVPLLNDGVHQPRAQDYNCRHMRLDGAESARHVNLKILNSTAAQP
jgi:hypothetical protein